MLIVGASLIFMIIMNKITIQQGTVSRTSHREILNIDFSIKINFIYLVFLTTSSGSTEELTFLLDQLSVRAYAIRRFRNFIARNTY